MVEMSAGAVRARSGGAVSSVEPSAHADSQEGAGASADDGLKVMTVRPRRSLFRRIALQAAFVGLPLIGIAAWSEQQFNPGTRSALWWTLLIMVALVVYVIVRYRRTEISVSPYGLVERGFFGGLNSVAARDVVSIVRLYTYRGASIETTPQLFLLGRDGRCLLRMRGTFWNEAAMDAVSAGLGVEEIVRPAPVTMSELRASDPHLLYWFEQRLRRPKLPDPAA